LFVERKGERMRANGNGDDEHKTRPSADEATAMLGALLGQMLDRLVAAHAGAPTPLLERIDRRCGRQGCA
jgi:hypothetical protein